jgi:ABC-type branched-subunit amino acid transport system ATPase component
MATTASDNVETRMAAVLEVKRLRVDVGGVPQIDGLTLKTAGERVLVLAAPSALFAVVAGLVRPRHGEILINGLTPADAVRDGVAAGVPLDPPLPPTWTASEYVRWNARAAGQSKDAADEQTREALAKLKLDAVATARLRSLPLTARRALGVAAALATGASTLLLEAPLAGLLEEPARSLARLVVRATESRNLVTFAPRTSLASPLATDADESIVLDGDRVIAQGAPAEVATRDRVYSLRLRGSGAAFAAAAERKGARVSGEGSSWVVDLGASLRVSDLLDVAAASESVVLELRPLAFAFG